jgi:hypothetical protein
MVVMAIEPATPLSAVPHTLEFPPPVPSPTEACPP